MGMQKAILYWSVKSMRRIAVILFAVAFLAVAFGCGTAIREAPIPSQAPELERTWTVAPEPQPAVTEPARQMLTLRAGDIVAYGKYNWIVLEASDDEALLLSERVLEHREFSVSGRDAWGECSLRKYLNGDFCNHTFTNEEQTFIPRKTIYTGMNPWYKQAYGHEAEMRVFLLSIEECVRYLGDSRSLYGRDGTSRYLDDNHNTKRIAKDLQGNKSIWWLRTPDNNNHGGTFVYEDGRISVSGFDEGNPIRGVRPAFWLNITDNPYMAVNP